MVLLRSVVDAVVENWSSVAVSAVASDEVKEWS